MDIKKFAKQIRLGNDDFIEKAYLQFYDVCTKTLMKNYSLNINDAQNYYVESFLLLREKCLQRKRKNGTTLVKNFLLTTSMNLYKRSHRNQNIHLIEDQSINPLSTYFEDTEPSAEELQMDKIAKAIELLPVQCSRVLKMFYFDGLSIRRIMKRMHYNSELVTSTKKYKCMEKLRQLYLSMND